MDSLEVFRLFVLGKLSQIDIAQEFVFKVELVLEEVLTNVVRYGYPGGVGDVEVGCGMKEDGRFCFYVTDWGVPFNPLERADPELSEDLSERQVGGLGIYLVRHLVDELSYMRQDTENTLTFCFHIPKTHQREA